MAYRTTPSGVVSLGAASHEDLLAALVGGPVCGEARLGVDTIRRSVVIDDFVYSFSALGVAVHDAITPEVNAITPEVNAFTPEVNAVRARKSPAGTQAGRAPRTRKGRVRGRLR